MNSSLCALVAILLSLSVLSHASIGSDEAEADRILSELMPSPHLDRWNQGALNETAASLGFTGGVYGVDVSTPVSTSKFRCLKSKGLNFAVARAWHSTGTPDTAAPGTVAAAWSAGIAHVDVYMFPCFGCGNPSGQVRSLVSFLSSHGVKYGMIWLDIEGPGIYWGTNRVANQAFFNALRDEVVGLGKSLGVYTSASQWVPIFGSSFTGGSAHHLWYAHYDGSPSFGDFKSFGGWTRPNVKQYSDKGSQCGVSYDINWYP